MLLLLLKLVAFFFLFCQYYSYCSKTNSKRAHITEEKREGRGGEQYRISVLVSLLYKKYISMYIYIYALYYSYLELQMLMLRPLGNRQFSRVPYGTAQSEQATAASQWAKAHIDRNAGRVYTRQDSARSSWRAIGPRTSSANTRRRGIWVERRDTKWRTRPALLCTSSLVRWKSEK